MRDIWAGWILRNGDYAWLRYRIQLQLVHLPQSSSHSPRIQAIHLLLHPQLLFHIKSVKLLAFGVNYYFCTHPHHLHLRFHFDILSMSLNIHLQSRYSLNANTHRLSSSYLLLFHSFLLSTTFSPPLSSVLLPAFVPSSHPKIPLTSRYEPKSKPPPPSSPHRKRKITNEPTTRGSITNQLNR